MITPEDPLSCTALHEACHLLVFVKSFKHQKNLVESVRIRPKFGSVTFACLPKTNSSNVELATVYAAGIACQLKLGNSLQPAINDKAKLSKLFPALNEQEIIIEKTLQWLERNWRLVERVAFDLKSNLKANGYVQKKPMKQIVELIGELL
jgi:hypothetical protein